MQKTPKSMRLQIGIFGRTNVGKSTFLNYVTKQDVAITSPIPGTTTDVVEKVMEFLPVGPVVFLDTAGIDDVSELSKARIKKTKAVFERADVFVLITEPNVWGRYECEISDIASAKKAPLIIIVNKSDAGIDQEDFLSQLRKKYKGVITCSSIDEGDRERVINEFKRRVIEVCPEDFLNPPPLLGDLVRKGKIAILIVPIDLEAPKGRIILPQVQAVRDALDSNAAALVVKESEYKQALKALKEPPDVVICDSQVVHEMVKNTPKKIKCSTFSILLARQRGNLEYAAKSARAIDKLKNGDRVLIAESCSHHPIQDDIGRVKIPKWIKEYTKKDISFSSCAGHDYPEDLKQYKLVIHCGSCMIGRREMLSRVQRAKEAGVPITNYGVAIAHVKGVLERVLSPFPEALDAYKNARVK